MERMMNVPEPKPLDERFREAEQYAFDFAEPAPARTPPPDFEETKQCGKAFCYCPRCNPR